MGPHKRGEHGEDSTMVETQVMQEVFAEWSGDLFSDFSSTCFYAHIKVRGLWKFQSKRSHLSDEDSARMNESTTQKAIPETLNFSIYLLSI